MTFAALFDELVSRGALTLASQKKSALRKLAAALGTTTRVLRAERRGGEKVTKERKKVQRHLSRARQEMKAALQTVRDVQFSEEDVELLRRQNEAGCTGYVKAA